MLRLFIMRYKLYKKYKERVRYLRGNDMKLFELVNQEISSMEREIYCEERIYFDDQHMFLWCPNCGDDLVGTSSFIRYDSDDHLIYKCSKCGCGSKWVNDGVAAFVIESDVDK